MHEDVPDLDDSALPDGRAEMFRNRLRKNLRRLLPWAARRDIEAYRLYDSDIPEVRLIVERYGSHLLLSEYARRADAEPEMFDRRERFLTDVTETLVTECGVARDDIFVKHRHRQRTATAGQYERLNMNGEPGRRTQPREIVVREGGHRFLINLSDYLDTGLFLDHRETRALVGKLAPGKRVLNLFGYTGSFTVYAAKGGATGSVTVDLSRTYLDWAARNFAQNGLDLERHRLVRADALAFLREPAARLSEHVPEGPRGRRGSDRAITSPADGTFELIVLDPPTFSNSKRMQGTLDVARDHPWLIGQALRLLSSQPDSALLFSCNNRRFTLRAGDLPASLVQSPGPGSSQRTLEIRDLSSETLPFDFHDPRTRSCYLIRR